MRDIRCVALTAVLLWPVAIQAQAVSPSDASAGGPENPPSRIVITADDEPGEPLILWGTIVAADGVTPVAGARLYVYHTDAAGIYSEVGWRRPRLRGWLRTGSDGRYELRTIRPGHYPSSRVPAHVHATVSAPGYAERWIDSNWFEGDPYLTEAERKRARGRGRFSPLVALSRDSNGVWRGQRDIRLEE